MSVAARIWLLVLVSIAGGHALLACVSSNRGPGDANYFDHYRLVYSTGSAPGDIPPGLTDEIDRAAMEWNSRSCNENAHYPGGHSFPYFTSETGGTTREILVEYATGKNPENPGSCGNFAGSMITVFQKANLPGGGDYFCTNSAIFEDVVAHELGHLLGLKDSGCAGYGMQDTGFTTTGDYVDRQVQSSECVKAQETHHTKSEQRGDLCGSSGGPGCDDWNPSLCEPCGGC